MVNILIPEIISQICSYLDPKEVRKFRLCCKTFADVGARFAYHKVEFYLHYRDLDMLRRISLHPVASRNVRSLVYVGPTMEMPKMTLSQFRSYYSEAKTVGEAIAKVINEPLPPRIGDLQLVDLYKNYEAVLDRQEKILQDNADISCIEEAVSRFTSLEEITVSLCPQLYTNKEKTPFDGCLVPPDCHLLPKGDRHLDSLLSAVSKANIKLKKLSAGSFSWQFFQKPPAELSRAFSACADLTCLKLCIDTGILDEPIAGEGPIFGSEVAECRRLMQTGLLRAFLKSLHRLQTLFFTFLWHSDDHGYPARLEDIIEPKHTWGNLGSLTLGNISCERQDLMSLLKRHKSTLKILCLRDINLSNTSWKVLLPKIRRTMDLDDACICGELSGRGESTHDEEYWNLSYPGCYGESSRHRFRDEINDYLVNNSDRRCCPFVDEVGYPGDVL
ncbi:hypothetical protein AAE478_005242 [Parahypoxylon ruwenzoriense]